MYSFGQSVRSQSHILEYDVSSPLYGVEDAASDAPPSELVNFLHHAAKTVNCKWLSFCGIVLSRSVYLKKHGKLHHHGFPLHEVSDRPERLPTVQFGVQLAKAKLDSLFTPYIPFVPQDHRQRPHLHLILAEGAQDASQQAQNLNRMGGRKIQNHFTLRPHSVACFCAYEYYGCCIQYVTVPLTEFARWH